MKKVISVLLMACILVTSGIFAVGAYSLPEGFSVSANEGDSFDTITGTVYGYLGDADESLTVNIKDATAIQKHIASIASLSENGVVVADADLTGDITIKDATAIQKWVAGMVINSPIYHVLYKGEEAPAASIVGTWETTTDIAEAINAVLVAYDDPLLAEHVNIETFVANVTSTFNEDGTYTIVFDEEVLNESVEKVKAELKGDMKNYIEAVAAESGISMSAEQLLSHMGYASMDNFVNEMFPQDMVDEMAAPVEGTYKAEDGKLYIDELDGDYYETYTLTADTLTITGNSYDELLEVYPIVFNRVG